MLIPKILITAGEPAGIGPEIVVKLAQESCPAQLIVAANKELLLQTASELNLPLELSDYQSSVSTAHHRDGHLWVIDHPLEEKVLPGMLNAANSNYVLSTLKTAADLALSNEVDAILTGPVHKAILNETSSDNSNLSSPISTSEHKLAFSGHTEFFAEQAGVNKVVMMLATDGLRVALATTHLPLSQVSAQITPPLLTEVLTILCHDMKTKFAITHPKIMVLGLNPHAGEDGHLGMEEIDVIIPTLKSLSTTLDAELMGPIPADTAFKPDLLAKVDCVLAMYHDQGLPVLKHKGFGQAINLTLGLPFIRTSVDHGTGLDIAGKNQADIGSMRYALTSTIELIHAQTSQGVA